MSEREINHSHTHSLTEPPHTHSLTSLHRRWIIAGRRRRLAVSSRRLTIASRRLTIASRRLTIASRSRLVARHPLLLVGSGLVTDVAGHLLLFARLRAGQRLNLSEMLQHLFLVLAVRYLRYRREEERYIHVYRERE